MNKSTNQPTDQPKVSERCAYSRKLETDQKANKTCKKSPEKLMLKCTGDKYTKNNKESEIYVQ